MENYNKNTGYTEEKYMSPEIQNIKLIINETDGTDDIKQKSNVPDTEPNSKTDMEMDFQKTDIGNAERLIKDYGENIHFLDHTGKWVVWNGKVWVTDDTGEVHRMAHTTIRNIYEEALHLQSQHDRTSLKKHALETASKESIYAMLEIAKKLKGVTLIPDRIDTNLWLLNCQNGTLDLKTGELHPHKREDLITKLIPVSYNPEMKTPEWDKFLKRIMDNNEDMINYLQRAIGYSLTGESSEQVMFILVGNGCNGKSTLLDTVSSMLGNEYVRHLPCSSLTTRSYEGVPTDIAMLKGSRFVVSVEVENGKQLDESRIKAMTGGDMLTGRFMRRDFFSFKPEFKIFMATNYLPNIKGTDEGIWRRMRVIPFNVRIPENERDHSLPYKLCEELPGILAWVVKGCLKWQKDHGLGYPAAVKTATEEYRTEMDTIGRFLYHCCIIEAPAKVPNAKLKNAYDNWCKQEEEKPVSQRILSKYLDVTKKFICTRSGENGSRVWNGIRLKTQDEINADGLTN